MIALIDLDTGNLSSVMAAFQRVGGEVTRTNAPEDIERARAVVLPGVGAFGEGMAVLRGRGLAEPLRRHALERGRPLLGICLGLQFLADEGEENGRHAGLGLIPGRVVRLAPDRAGYRVPNIGWCDLTIERPGRLLPAPPARPACYFVHSYWLDCADPADRTASIEYSGRALTAAVERHNVMGCQFHPEKSQQAGLDMLHAFLSLVAQA